MHRRGRADDVIESPVVEVEDTDDPRLDEVARLTDSEARRHADAERGIFIAEGILVLETAMATGRGVRFVLCSPHRLPLVRETIAGTGAPIYVADKPALAAITGFPMHRGIIGSIDRWPLPHHDALFATADRAVIVEGVGDHENVGGLFRNAAAFGVTAMTVDDRTADPLYRRAVRVSIGNVMRVPWTRVSATTAITSARRAGLGVAALTPGGDTPIHDLDPSCRWAFVLGAEGPGLTDEAVAGADVRVAIPMASGVDSLNVATAAAVSLGVLARR